MSPLFSKSFGATFVASIVSLSLAACVGGPSASGGVQKRAEAKSGFLGMQKTDNVVANTPAAFKNADTLVIGSFIVGFATYKTDSTKAGGGLMGNGFGGRSTAKSTLNGVNDATMQAITNKAYDNFVASLKAKGYTIADRSGWTSYPELTTVKATPSPYEDSNGSLFGTNSKTKYFAPTALGAMRPFLGDIPGLSGGFSGLGANATTAAVKYAQEKGVKVVNAVYVVDFANSSGYGSKWTSTSSVDVGQGLTVVGGLTKIAIWGGEGGTFSTNNGSLVLGQPITSEKEFATVADSTSDASRASETAANIIGVIGGVGTNAKRDFTFEARPADYQAAANDAISQANSEMTTKMSSLK